MISFKEFSVGLLNEEKRVHTHSTHIEDLLFVDGKSGLERTLKAFDDIKNSFGTTDISDNRILSTKIDGSPAVIAGWLGNNFFVASKGLFNKTPKINFTDDDVERNHGASQGLAKKLKVALKYFKSIIPKWKIFQGDFLYDVSDRKSEVIDGNDCWTWHPNTIKYAIEKDSPLGKRIGASKVGVVFHTEYSSDGEDVSSISLKGFNVTTDDLNPSNDVWATDAFQKSIGSIPHLTETEEKEYNRLIRKVRTLSSKVPWTYCRDFKVELMAFINTYIANGRQYPSSLVMANDYEEYLLTKKQKEKDSKKTENGKLAVDEKYKDVLQMPSNLDAVFEIYKILTDIKLNIFVKKVNDIKSTKTFLVKKDGTMVATNDEGYVLTKTDANGCKLVDRLEFARANFSSLFAKGWEHKNEV